MSVSRRLAAATAAAALSVTGVAVLSPAVATAAECSADSSRTFVDTGIDYTITQEVVGSAEVAPGGTVTYRTKVTSDDAFGGTIAQITDHHPAGFTLIKAEVDAGYLVGPRKVVDETDAAIKNTVASTVRVTGGITGWTTSTTYGGYVALSTTYRVPESAEPGEKLASGTDITLNKVGSDRHETFDPSGVCVTIREKNAVETVTGLLDGAGLGSATGSADGSSELSSGISDPQGFIAGIINQLDLAEIIGLS